MRPTASLNALSSLAFRLRFRYSIDCIKSNTDDVNCRASLVVGGELKVMYLASRISLNSAMETQSLRFLVYCSSSYRP